MPHQSDARLTVHNCGMVGVLSLCVMHRENLKKPGAVQVITMRFGNEGLTETKFFDYIYKKNKSKALYTV